MHWADRASLRLVLYLLQRLDEMAVSIIAARRLGEPGAPDDLLAQISTHVASRSVRPAPLSREGARRMVGAAMRGADEAFADACWRMTEGNVFLLEELIAAVQAEGWQPTAQNAARIGTLAPEAVLRAVAVRLMRLSDDAAGVARAVAVLGDDAQLRHVVALTGRAAERVAAAADALAASDILRPADAGALRFAHPLLASAVYADIATAERATLHRRAAEILHDEEVAPERVAAHLLPSPGSGEAWVVDVLCAVGAARARRRRARVGRQLPVAARCRSRPAASSAPGCCASWAPARPRRACRARSSTSRRRWRPAPPAGAAGDRARTLLALGRALAAAGRHAEALARFDAAAALRGRTPPCGASRRRRPRPGRWACSIPSGGRRCWTRRARRGERRGRGRPCPPAAGALIAMRCLHRALAGAPRDEVVALARAAAEGDGMPAEQDAGATVPLATSVALQACDELLWSEREMTAALDRARATGSTVAFATASLARAASRWAQGRLVDALADAERALDAERYGWRHLLPCAYGTVAGLLVERGELAAAAATAARLDAAAYAGSAMLAPWHEALGRLALAERREADALAHFEAWRDVVAGVANPACGAAWRSASVPALVSLGRRALDAQRYGWRHLLPSAYGTVAGLLVDRGELSAAAATAARFDPSGYAGSALLAPWHEALGRLALAQRREADALTHFEAWRDVVSGIANPACGAAWRSASVPALVSLGRVGRGARARARGARARPGLRRRARDQRRAARARPRQRARRDRRPDRAARGGGEPHGRLRGAAGALPRAARARDGAAARAPAHGRRPGARRRARGRSRLRGAARRGARARGARGGGHADAARRSARRRFAEPERAARRRARDRGAVEPADRRGAVRDAQGRRVAPRQRVSQARRALTPRAAGRAQRLALIRRR